MLERLEVTFARTRDEKPLVIVESSIGNGAEFTPAQLRAVAAVLVRAANEADLRPTHGKLYVRGRRTYEIQTAPAVPGKRRTTDD